MSGNVINAKDMLLYYDCHLNALVRLQVLDYLYNGGMDIVGSIPIDVTQKKLLLLATNYFSKWVELEAYDGIKDKDVSKFFWKNIVFRFGIPQGPQFDNNVF